MTDPVEFNDADALEVGAFGEPGQRLFLLQARQGAQVLTVKVEKGQVAQLADHLTEAMASHVPIEVAAALPDDARLAEETEPAWSVGSVRLGYDESAGRVALG